MIYLNDIAEIHQHIAANKGRPITFGLPPRVVLNRALNIKHDADVALVSTNTEIVGEQISVTTPGAVTFSGLCHLGASEMDDAAKSNFVLGNDDIGAIDGRGLIAFAKSIGYHKCTILNFLDDGYGGEAETIMVDGCLIGHSWIGDKCGLVSNAKRLTISDSVFVGARYRQPVRAKDVAEIIMRRNVIVGTCFHMEANGVKQWTVRDNWYWPYRMGLHRPICPRDAGDAVCVGNFLHGERAGFAELFGTLRGRNDLQNRSEAKNVGNPVNDAWRADPVQYFGGIIDRAGAPVVNAVTMLAKRMAKEGGGLQ